MSEVSEKKKLLIKCVKSTIGSSVRQKGTMRALGLRHLGDVVKLEDTPTVRGMVRQVRHLVQVQESE